MSNAYQSPQSDLHDDNSTEVIYVGFWARTAASVIDSIWLYGIIYVILYFILGKQVFTTDLAYSPVQGFFEYVVPIFVVMGFWIIKSATPGKMLLKMKIVDADTHEKVSGARLLLRYIAYFASMLPLFLGFMWVGWDKKKQGWHDKIARTVVIRSS